MQEMWVENYRCFRERQTARLAPLTLLVGENSTGKTSFLAMARALRDVGHGRRTDFKEAPYDLGSFDEVAHFRGGRGGRAEMFRAGFAERSLHGAPKPVTFRFDVRFGQAGSAPAVRKVNVESDDLWLAQDQASLRLEVGAEGRAWCWDFSDLSPAAIVDDQIDSSWDWHFPLLHASEQSDFRPSGNCDRALPEGLLYQLQDLARLPSAASFPSRPFAAGPVRSRPHRTYDPAPFGHDPEGAYVPMFLADTFFRRPKHWEHYRKALETFGRESGLFDELRIRPLGKRGTEPFQVQVRKSGRAKGPYRNLIDVGYGVSQVLPILTELFRPGMLRSLLLQQPEVHLHPSAQAALGTLFCQLAAGGTQLLVETHSDHLMDRVRMDVRDSITQLKPEDVSILYFERGNLDVRIHSLEIDGEGNIIGAPPGYRQFFMDEVDRSLR